MTEEDKRWLAALLIALGGFAALCCGCVNLAPGMSFVDDHVDQLIEESERIAPLVPEDSVARPFLENVHWRAKERMKPWTRELKRATGEVIAEAPRLPTDHRRTLAENQAQAQLKTENDYAETSPFGGGGGGALSLILGACGLGGAGLGGLGLKKVIAWAMKWKLRAQHGYSAMNAMKAVSPEMEEIVKAHTKNDSVLSEGYAEEKARVKSEQRKNHADALQRFTS